MRRSWGGAGRKVEGKKKGREEGGKEKERKEKRKKKRKKETASDKMFQKKIALTHNFHYFHCRDRLRTSERIAYLFMKSSADL